MGQKEIQMWIDRWSKLKPSPKRDMVIKIWSKDLKRGRELVGGNRGAHSLND